MGIRQGDILVIEDNAADRRLMFEAFREAGHEARLRFVSDGVEALDYLNGRNPYQTAARPQLILLDLNLPKKDGRQVLSEIKHHPSHRYIPVIVFTTSVADEDISRCYEAQANCYIAKPYELERYLDVIKHIEQFWLRTAELPSKSHPPLH